LFSKSPLITIEGNTHLPGETSAQDRVLKRTDRNTHEMHAFIRFDLADGGAAPPPVYPAWAGRVLMLRSPFMTGPDVRMWQQQMANRGLPLHVDGIYGPESDRSCRAF